MTERAVAARSSPWRQVLRSDRLQRPRVQRRGRRSEQVRDHVVLLAGISDSSSVALVRSLTTTSAASGLHNSFDTFPNHTLQC